MFPVQLSFLTKKNGLFASIYYQMHPKYYLCLKSINHLLKKKRKV